LNLTVEIIDDTVLEDLMEEFEVSVTATTSVTGVPIEIPQESISVSIIDDDGMHKVVHVCTQEVSLDTST